MIQSMSFIFHIYIAGVQLLYSIVMVAYDEASNFLFLESGTISNSKNKVNQIMIIELHGNIYQKS